MTHLINKSALVAEIERKIKSVQLSIINGRNAKKYNALTCVSLYTCVSAYKEILSLINDIEAKDVNEVPATIMVNKYGNRFISSCSGLKEYNNFKDGEEIKILIPEVNL